MEFKALTQKQRKILEFIEKEIKRTGNSPTYRAIAKHFHLKAVGTVQDHIAKLLELGALEKAKDQRRGLQLPFQDRVTWIPILGNVPAGTPQEALTEAQGSLAVAGNLNGKLFALRVQGQSMQDRGILDQDFVIVRQQSDAESGEIVVALINHEATVKTLQKNRTEIRLLPANSEFKPIELIPDNENRIVGKVIAVHRNY